MVPKDEALRTPPLGARARWKHNQSVAFAVGACKFPHHADEARAKELCALSLPS